MKKQVRLQFIWIFLFGAISFGAHGQVQIGVDIDGEAASDFSGRSVSLSSDGSVLAIGADGNDENGNRSGHVRVYKRVEDATPPAVLPGNSWALISMARRRVIGQEIV